MVSGQLPPRKIDPWLGLKFELGLGLGGTVLEPCKILYSKQPIKNNVVLVFLLLTLNSLLWFLYIGNIDLKDGYDLEIPEQCLHYVLSKQ